LVLTISVLCVDDEPPMLELFKRYLERTDEFTVTTASSAPDALHLLESGGFQAIVSDYQMPGMAGIAFLKQVRATDTHTPFIMFTGKGWEAIAVEAFENGADFYLQKGDTGTPSSMYADMAHKIKSALKHRQADAEVIALNQLYSVLSATNKSIVRIHNTSELLNEICRIVVETGGFTMAWAGLVNPENHLIEPVGSSGCVEGYLDTIAISADDTPRGRGPTGTAFRERTFNVCNDIEHDPKMAPWRKAALERGYRSCAAFPFALDTERAGVITLYASEPGFFTDRIVRLLEEQSGDISFALETLIHEERRIAAEKDLVTSELQYRRLFETAQNAILILDGDTGQVIDANRFILDMLGYPREYFIGKHLWELGFIRDKSLAEQAFVELKTKGFIRYEDLPLERYDGQQMDVEFISNAYIVGDRKIFQCNIRDFTERKKQEMALSESESRYRRLLNVLNEGIWSIDKDSRTTFVNPRMAEMLGYSVDEMLGRSLFSFMDEPAKEIAHEKIENRQRGFGEQNDFEFLKKDGSRMYASLETASITGTDGSYIGAIAAVQDITERKAAEEARKTFSEDLERKVIDRTSSLGDSNRKLMTEIEIRLDAEKQLMKTVGEKDVLLREVHHRVKNNLQIIISLLNLQSRFITDEATLSAFRECQNRVRAMALVHEKLYQSKDLAKLDLGNYLKFLGDNLFQFLGMKGRGITLTMDIRDIFLAIDTAIPLGLMINELISNSLKYAFPDGRKGEITLAVRKEGHTLTILFRDTGVGIPGDFDWRNARSLGLRLVISLVEQLDGTIELDRRSGTAFSIVVKEKE
jgi:PAS domain S-box-containing protein